jgi:hypothetical protein
MLQFQIEIPREALAVDVANAESALGPGGAGGGGSGASSDRGAMLDRVASTLKELILRDFDVKSAGGAGADGTKWLADKSVTVKAKGGDSRIGVRSGELKNSLKVDRGVGDADLIAAFESDHAKFFDRARPLIPETLPSAWDEAVSAIVAPWAEQVIEREIGVA